MTSPRTPSPCVARGLVLALTVWTVGASLFAAEPSAQWPFSPLATPPLPRIRSEGWVRNPVDRFILAKLEEVGLKPTPRADKVALLRRITYDLTGLAPTAAEREAFLQDSSPDAYEKVVDRLLRSPRFGERWAQHWLDLVRYAESEGYKVDRMRDEAYRYRDYVIRAFNENMPFDRFLSQQIAGDELEPKNPDAIVAMGFWRLHMEETNGDNYRRIRQDILDDNTDVFASVFFGLSFSCARCHDHKFDPITQKDYFRIQAFFAPLIDRDGVPLATDEEKAKYDRQYAVWERATREIREQIDRMVEKHSKDIGDETALTFDADTQAALKLSEEKRSPEQKQMVLLAQKQLSRRQSRAYRRLKPDERAVFDELDKKLTELDRLKPAPLPVALTVSEIGPELPVCRVLGGGNPLRPKEEVQPGFPAFLSNEEPTIERPAARPDSSGRRSALVKWMTRPDHPLTARVIVNRLWGHHMGDGIVGTPNDFGAQGEKATHPELLDFLATELVRQKWDLKAIHRMIVTSATYMQSSNSELNPAEASGRKLDPKNDLLWHAQSRRRDGESVRDTTLQLSGRLNYRMFGKSAQPELPAPLDSNSYAWSPDSREEDRNRRSIYVVIRRNLPFPLLSVLDSPDRIGSCPERAVTTTAPQALALLNSTFTLEQAKRIAGNLLHDHGNHPSILVRQAYLLVYNREPTTEELAGGQRFLERQSRLTGKGEALVDLCHALLNTAEFLYVD